MDVKCKNCKYFRRGSVMRTKYVWGDCLKPGKYGWDAHGAKTPGVFTWDNKSCDDFEPRKTHVEKPVEDSL
jgi:hypothetical protein